jgi:hypothetical protein
MAVTYSATVKNNRLTQVVNAIDGGAGAGTLEIGTSGMSAVLAVLTLSDPCGSVSGGVLTFDTITADSEADSTGTAAEARIKDSDGNIIVSGLTVSTSGANVNLDNTSINEGQQVSLTSAAITHA